MMKICDTDNTIQTKKRKMENECDTGIKTVRYIRSLTTTKFSNSLHTLILSNTYLEKIPNICETAITNLAIEKNGCLAFPIKNEILPKYLQKLKISSNTFTKKITEKTLVLFPTLFPITLEILIIYGNIFEKEDTEDTEETRISCGELLPLNKMIYPSGLHTLILDHHTFEYTLYLYKKDILNTYIPRYFKKDEGEDDIYSFASYNGVYCNTYNYANDGNALCKIEPVKLYRRINNLITYMDYFSIPENKKQMVNLIWKYREWKAKTEMHPEKIEKWINSNGNEDADFDTLYNTFINTHFQQNSPK